MNHLRHCATRSSLCRIPARFFLVLAVLFCVGKGSAQSSSGLWEEIGTPAAQALNSKPVWIQPNVFRSFKLNHTLLHPILDAAPKEASRLVAFSDNVLALPMPDGSTRKFRFVESPLMAPDLAVEFPEIKTYVGQGLDNPRDTVRFDLTPAGFHAQILSPEGAVYIDPFYTGDTNTYTCYYKRDYSRAAKDFLCLAPTVGKGVLAPAAILPPQALSGSNLRTYRLACAATGEYTQFHGGTVSAGMSAIVTAAFGRGQLGEALDQLVERGARDPVALDAQQQPQLFAHSKPIQPGFRYWECELRYWSCFQHSRGRAGRPRRRLRSRKQSSR